jgi:hypothetical protein
MKKNESGFDRIIRVVLGVALILMFAFHALSGTLGIISLAVGAILLLTGVVGFCPLYALLKLQTTKQ